MPTDYVNDPLAEEIESDPNGAVVEILRMLSKLSDHCQESAR